MTTEAAIPIHDAVRRGVGCHAPGDLAVLAVRGPDAGGFLQTQTTNDVKALAPGRGQMSASLDPKAHVVAVFTLHWRGDEFVLVVDAARAKPLAQHLEKHHILEDLAIADRSAEFRFLSLEGPRSAGLLSRAFPGVAWPEEEFAIAPFPPGGPDAFAVRRSETGEDGLLLAVGPESFDAVSSSVRTAGREFGLVEIGPEAKESLRIEAGVPRWGADYDEEQILPATGLENRTASYTKGCYIGQEVVARIKTYGAVSRALIGLVFEGDELPPPRSPIVAGGKEVGEIRSGTLSPTLRTPIALAYLLRDVREAGRTIEFEAAGRGYRARIVLPPFVERADRRERAAALTVAAQRDFAEGREDRAVAGLREAIALDPGNTEAYESLGVIVSRRGEYEEAIEIMKELARIAPDLPMAWTNLSLYHMRLGHKDEAEEARGRAALLSIRAQATRARQEKAEAARRKADLEALERRLEMFRQVLAIDPDDHLANFGLGKGLLELDRPEEALPWLERANAVKPDHSVGWVELGKCLERLARNQDARDAYRRGIAVATKRGDLMPLQEMQRYLASLG